MPITKQAIKRMKQNEVAKTRNKHYTSRMKSMVKLILTYVQQGEMENAKKVLPEVVKTIDMAAKKNLIHANNAANKKSRIQKAVNTGVTNLTVVKSSKKAAPKVKKTSPKKEVKPEVKKVEEKVEAKEELKVKTEKSEEPKKEEEKA